MYKNILKSLNIKIYLFWKTFNKAVDSERVKFIAQDSEKLISDPIGCSKVIWHLNQLLRNSQILFNRYC